MDERNYTIDEIVRNIKVLDDKVTEGFRGTHERLNIANGKIQNATDWITENKEFVKDLKAERKAIYRKFTDLAWKMTTTAVMVFLGYRHFM